MFGAIFFLICGIIIGRIGINFWGKWPLQKISFWAILVLLFIMGAQIGTDSEIIKNLPSLGFKALVLSLGALGGSIFISYLWVKIVKK